MFLVQVMINQNDGSVTIVMGGVEIGQGINTKVSNGVMGEGLWVPSAE